MSNNSQEDLYNSSDSVRSARPLLYVQSVTFSEPFKLRNGGVLPEVTVAYETYGTLNERKDNAILICHALSGDSHVAAHNEEDDPGWWDVLIGSGKYLDTDKYFVICPNILGGCRGTTGPDCINPETGHRYGMDFPVITIEDIVEVQRKLIEDHLGIDRLLGIIGGSLGGLMALVWATQFPEKVLSVIGVATSPHLSSQSLAFDIVARNAIVNDPHFNNGQYYDNGKVPSTGLAIARMLGHITYLSRESMTRKFGDPRNKGREIKTEFETRFSIGSYLAHQGSKFVERFDANSYVVLSTALDTFDLGAQHDKRTEVMRNSMCRFLFISFTSDWLFPAFQAQELVDAAVGADKRVSYCNIKSDCGHDAFLLENELPVYGGMIKGFLHHIRHDLFLARDPEAARAEREKRPEFHFPKPAKHRIDFDRILELIPAKTKILDLGCGKGDLLARLKESGHERLVGIELEQELVLHCVEKGLDVIQADLNQGLPSFFEHQFDFVVLSKTLQTVHNVELVLEEMLRVGTRAIVSFPNLGYYRFRKELSEDGRAPHIDPREGRKWYNMNDVRFLTIDDFKEFCSEKGYIIHKQVALDTERGAVVENAPNLNADVAIMVLSKEK